MSQALWHVTDVLAHAMNIILRLRLGSGDVGVYLQQQVSYGDSDFFLRLQAWQITVGGDTPLSPRLSCNGGQFLLPEDLQQALIRCSRRRPSDRGFSVQFTWPMKIEDAIVVD